MNSISMVEAGLPAGFRFHPKDEELVCEYLMKKITLSQSLFPLLIEVDLNKCEPWDIPESACVGGKEWYFYSQRDRKYATGLRTNRATTSGYWKATGKDKDVLDKNTLVGMRKTLVFYHGRAPKGQKSEWVMHEFRLEGPLTPPTFPSKEDLVLCKVFHKYKDVIAKSAMARSSYDEPEIGPTPLPPLMDSYQSFGQTEKNSIEQVPCFSGFSGFSSNQNDPDPVLSQLMLTEMEPNYGANSNMFGGIFVDNTSSRFDLCYQERKVMEMVLNNLSRLDENPSLKVSPWLGEGSSSLPYTEAETITSDEISNLQFPLR